MLPRNGGAFLRTDIQRLSNTAATSPQPQFICLTGN
jgi:hypothetical protein